MILKLAFFLPMKKKHKKEIDRKLINFSEARLENLNISTPDSYRLGMFFYFYSRFRTKEVIKGINWKLRELSNNYLVTDIFQSILPDRLCINIKRNWGLCDYYTIYWKNEEQT